MICYTLHYTFNYHAPRHLHVFRALMRVTGNWVPYSSWNFTVCLACGHWLLLRPALQSGIQYIYECGTSLCHVLQAFDNKLCNLDFSFPSPSVRDDHFIVAMSHSSRTANCVVVHLRRTTRVNGVQFFVTSTICKYFLTFNSKK